MQKLSGVVWRLHFRPGQEHPCEMLTIALRCLVAGTAAAVALKLSKQAVRNRPLSLGSHGGALAPDSARPGYRRSSSQIQGGGPRVPGPRQARQGLSRRTLELCAIRAVCAVRLQRLRRQGQERFGWLGYAVKSMHEFGTADAIRAAVLEASCIFVGGGGTYRLMKCLQEDPALLPLVRGRRP